MTDEMPEPRSASDSVFDDLPFVTVVPPPVDPLDDLVGRVKADGRVVYQDDVIAALAALEDADPVRFAKIHWGLTAEADVVSGMLRRAIQRVRAAEKKAAKAAEKAGPTSVVDVMLGLAAGAHFFTAPYLGDELTTFVDFPDASGRRVTSLVQGRTFRRWLTSRLYQATHAGASAEGLTTALSTLEARAAAEGHQHPVFHRIGEHDGAVYIDLGDATWNAIEVSPGGWRVVAEPPCRFIRSVSTRPLPVPVAGGSLRQLETLLNVQGDELKLCVGWLLGCLNPSGPYAILVVLGAHGTAKTSTLRVLHRLVDPNAGDVRTFPPTERDLLVAAQRSWVQPYDNLSGISSEMSDALCRLSTGGAMVLRALRTDADEVVLHAQRPVCLTGITEIVTRADLLDRCVFATPDTLTEFVEERDFWARFSAAAPEILGALLDAMSASLRARAQPTRTSPWRLADFIRWVSHAEATLGWPAGSFEAAYATNRAKSVLMTLEADPLASAMIAFMQDRTSDQPASKRTAPWSGTASDLHTLLVNQAGAGISTVPGWPKSPGTLGRALPRIVPALAAVGLSVRTQRTNTERRITLAWVVENAPGAVANQNGDDTMASPERHGRTRI